MKSRINMPVRLAAMLIAASGWTSAVQAHHSYAQYDRCSSMSIEGHIERLTWSNPHVLITVRTDDAETYLIEWFDLQRLRRSRIEQVLQTGDRILVTGSENRDPEKKIITLLTEIRRPSDGWAWSRPSPVNPPKSCA